MGVCLLQKIGLNDDEDSGELPNSDPQVHWFAISILSASWLLSCYLNGENKSFGLVDVLLIEFSVAACKTNFFCGTSNYITFIIIDYTVSSAAPCYLCFSSVFLHEWCWCAAFCMLPILCFFSFCRPFLHIMISGRTILLQVFCIPFLIA